MQGILKQLLYYENGSLSSIIKQSVVDTLFEQLHELQQECHEYSYRHLDIPQVSKRFREVAAIKNYSAKRQEDAELDTEQQQLLQERKAAKESEIKKVVKELQKLAVAIDNEQYPKGVERKLAKCPADIRVAVAAELEKFCSNTYQKIYDARKDALARKALPDANQVMDVLNKLQVLPDTSRERDRFLCNLQSYLVITIPSLAPLEQIAQCWSEVYKGNGRDQSACTPRNDL